MIRAAMPSDVPDLLRLIKGLADYEREPDAVETTEEALRLALFPTTGQPRVFADVAVCEGLVVGMAIWFYSFSTWTGRHGIWLEDLFIDPRHRGGGWGKALLSGLARRCVNDGLTRLEWCVLDWNEPAIGFYRSIGAAGQDEWTTQRLSGEALASLAAGSETSSAS